MTSVNWRTVLVSVFLLTAIGAFGKGVWQTTNDQLRIGSTTSSDDVKITATTGSGSADPTLKVNKTTKVWELGNNGVSFIPVADTTNSVQITGTQTVGGAKTFNDVTTFKAVAGTIDAASYDTTGAWTIGPTSGSAVTHTVQSNAATNLKVSTLASGSTDVISSLYPANTAGQAKLHAVAGTDSGSTSVMNFLATKPDGTSALTARPPFQWNNGATSVGSVSTSGVWTIGVAGANVIVNLGSYAQISSTRAVNVATDDALTSLGSGVVWIMTKLNANFGTITCQFNCAMDDAGTAGGCSLVEETNGGTNCQAGFNVASKISCGFSAGANRCTYRLAPTGTHEINTFSISH